jgi:predicted transcriptional regulator YheO
MTPDQILESYIPMVDFIANVFGENCEVVLHDLRKIDNSIIAIQNNHITGRTLNDTITDFALDIIHKEKHKKNNFICNYTGKTNNEQKSVRASTFFIRDQTENLIGMLCTNVDITSLMNTRRFIDKLIIDDGIDDTKEQENFSLSINEHVSLMISETLADLGTEPLRMTMKEKKQIVKQLEQKGVFRLKGVIGEVAKALEVSEQTVYRYLQELEKK